MSKCLLYFLDYSQRMRVICWQLVGMGSSTWQTFHLSVYGIRLWSSMLIWMQYEGMFSTWFVSLMTNRDMILKCLYDDSAVDTEKKASRRRYLSLQWRHNERDGISNYHPHDCLLNRLFRRKSKKTSKLRVTGLCVRNSPVTAQRASNAENVSIWWRHHVLIIGTLYQGLYAAYEGNHTNYLALSRNEWVCTLLVPYNDRRGVIYRDGRIIAEIVSASRVGFVTCQNYMCYVAQIDQHQTVNNLISVRLSQG